MIPMKAKPQNSEPTRTATAKTQKIPRKITRDYLRNAGLYYLGRYNATTHKFRSVMMNKISKSIKHHEAPPLSEAQDWLETVIADFTRLGYLNDISFSQSYIKGMREKGFSSRKMAQKLTEKGISDHAPASHDIDDLAQLLRHMKRKRLGPFSSRPVNAEKLLANLARQGFSYTDCQKALSMTVDEITDYLYELND